MTTQASNLGEFLGDFRSTVVTATERLRTISAEESARKSASDKWSIKEVLGHLIDSAANNHQRFVRAQFTDDPVFPGYEQEKWVNAQRRSEEHTSELQSRLHLVCRLLLEKKNHPQHSARTHHPQR